MGFPSDVDDHSHAGKRVLGGPRRRLVTCRLNRASHRGAGIGPPKPSFSVKPRHARPSFAHPWPAEQGHQLLLDGIDWPTGAAKSLNPKFPCDTSNASCCVIRARAPEPSQCERPVVPATSTSHAASTTACPPELDPKPPRGTHSALA